MKKKLMVILGVLFVVLPLGLISEYDAWGEWDKQTYEKLLGYIPQGIASAKSFSIIPDYGDGSVVMYYLSAVIGGFMIYGFLYLLTKFNRETN